jgi:hypothetical protein
LQSNVPFVVYVLRSADGNPNKQAECSLFRVITVE